jgi:hypothetical protein
MSKKQQKKKETLHSPLDATTATGLVPPENKTAWPLNSDVPEEAK